MSFTISFEEHLKEFVSSLMNSEDSRNLPNLGKNDREATDNIIKYVTAIDSLKKKRVNPKPREIKYSSKLKTNTKYQECLNRIKKLESLLRNAKQEVNDPKNHFLSRNVEFIFNRKENPDWVFIDKMLYEWGIMHFHLGSEKRTDDLLFAILDDQFAYFIDVRGHDSFHEHEILEIIYENWPNLLDFDVGIEGSRLIKEDVKNLRDKNMGHFPNVAGKALKPKDAISAGGCPARVIRDVDYYLNKLTDIENLLCDPKSETYIDILSKIGDPGVKLEFQCIKDSENFKPDRLLLMELNTNSNICLTIK